MAQTSLPRPPGPPAQMPHMPSMPQMPPRPGVSAPVFQPQSQSNGVMSNGGMARPPGPPGPQGLPGAAMMPPRPRQPTAMLPPAPSGMQQPPAAVSKPAGIMEPPRAPVVSQPPGPQHMQQQLPQSQRPSMPHLQSNNGPQGAPPGGPMPMRPQPPVSQQQPTTSHQNGFEPPRSGPAGPPLGQQPPPMQQHPQQQQQPHQPQPGPPHMMQQQPRPHHQPPPAQNGPPMPGMAPPMGRPLGPGAPPGGGLQRPGFMPPPTMGQPPAPQPGYPPTNGGMGPPPTMMGGPPPSSMAGPPMPGPPMPGPPMQSGMGPPQSQGGYPSQAAQAQPGGGYPPRPGMPGAGMAPPQPGYPGGPGGMQSPPRRTLDPDQMPSPIHVIEEDQKNNGGYFETKDKGLTPPLVTTNFITRDYGNASPRFIRSTMYNVPATPEMMKQTGVPFGLVISPFAKVEEGEIDPPVSDFGESGPVRCVRCKAYMCPFMQFIDGGRRFQCVFCKATTEVAQDYFQHLDHQGQRLDHYQRPELCLGAYECLATKDYCRDSVAPKTPGVIFAIDVSYPMMKEGIVQLICNNMKDLLKNLPRDMNCDKERLRVGFMTYDSKIHFYNINSGLSQPQQMTVGDVQDMFVPLVEGLMVNAEEAETVIDALLEQIPMMFGETRETETVLGPVIQAGKEAFKAAQCAGKLIVFHHNLPVAEAPGKLKNRDDRKLLGTEKEKTVLMPQSKFYNELGQECVGVGCSVDLFLFNNAYIDVATLSQVCRLTGGQLYKYTYFQPDVDGERFLKDLEHDLSRPIAFDAIMRVRTSTGVRPVEFYGSFYMANTTDTELASMNSDAAVACEIKHDDKLTEEDGVYVQAAVLFTSCSGQRRLRILNLALNCGSSMAEMYRNCELDTVVNFTAKQSISRQMESNPKTVKEHLINSCANILACYRKNCASPSSAGQLILPECMKLLPLYTNCLIKSDVIAGGADVGCDDRAFLMSAVSSMDVASSAVFFYPRLYPIHDLSTSETGLPLQIRCSIEKVRDDGVYLLENGIYLFMYIGLAVEPSWVREVFGVGSAAQIDIDKTRLEALDTPMSRRVNEVIEVIRGQRSRYMRLVIVRQRDKLDVLFRHYLCEDKSGNDAGNFSYVDFLCHMHKEIRQLLG